jgi:hypothetical protein
MDEIVGDDAESHPALHPIQAVIAATIQSVVAFQHADAVFAPGPPFLSGACVLRLATATQETPISCTFFSFACE